MCPRGRPRGQGRPRGLHLWFLQTELVMALISSLMAFLSSVMVLGFPAYTLFLR